MMYSFFIIFTITGWNVRLRGDIIKKDKFNAYE
jgi:hypothetical protein